MPLRLFLCALWAALLLVRLLLPMEGLVLSRLLPRRFSGPGPQLVVLGLLLPTQQLLGPALLGLGLESRGGPLDRSELLLQLLPLPLQALLLLGGDRQPGRGPQLAGLLVTQVGQRADMAERDGQRARLRGCTWRSRLSVWTSTTPGMT